MPTVDPRVDAYIARQAAKVWATFSPGNIRDYAEWTGEAKRGETRDKRIVEAVGSIAKGKDRNMEYR